MASARLTLAEAILAAGLGASEDLAFCMEHACFGDIRPADWTLLRLVHREAMPVSALAVPLGITQQATTKTVRALEDRDYVRGAGVDGDKRIREVSLAPRALKLLLSADAWAGEHQRLAVARWGAHEVQSATKLLTGFEATAERYTPVGRDLRAGIDGLADGRSVT